MDDAIEFTRLAMRLLDILETRNAGQNRTGEGFQERENAFGIDKRPVVLKQGLGTQEYGRAGDCI